MALSNSALTVADHVSVEIDRSQHEHVKDDRAEARAKCLTATGSADDRGRVNRNLSRSVASRVSEREHEKLLKEHGVLAFKEATGDISSEQLCRLGLVRWILGRIEDAELGPELDKLELLAELAEKTAKHVTSFVESARKPEASAPFFPPQTRDRKRRRR